MTVPRRLLVLLVCAAAGACGTTPDAADLVSSPASAGPVSEAEAAGALLDYVDVVNGALRTGDTTDLAAMTGPRCPCRELVGLVRERFADGASLEGASFDVGEVTVRRRDGRRAVVTARVSVSRYEVRNGDGLRVRTQPPQQFVATYTVARAEDLTEDQPGGGWRVVDVRRGR